MAGDLILIVEDNALNAKLLKDVLRASGYSIQHCETAEEGIAFARDRLPALVLMDIQLPGIDGTEALRRLKADEKTRDIPVIAVTASVMPMEREEILKAGFDGYQPKPLSVKLLLEEVRGFLND